MIRPFVWGVVLTSLFLTWGSYRYWTYWVEQVHPADSSQAQRGCDFSVYYARITHTGDPELETGWFYSNIAVIELSWMGWFSKLTTYILWTVLMIGSYFILLYKLLEVELGWLIALVTLKPFLLYILPGNVAPALALLCIWPWGMLLATSYKCYLAGFLVLFAAKRFIAQHALGDRENN